MAQLTTNVMQLHDNRHTRLGVMTFVAAGVTTLEPGMLVKFTSGSTVGLGSAGQVHGMAFGTRALTYSPTTQVFAAGEPVVCVEGGGEVSLSSFFFTSGTLPTAGSPVYAGANGLWDATATGGVKVARCIAQETVRQPLGTGGTTIAVARLVFDFEPQIG